MSRLKLAAADAQEPGAGAGAGSLFDAVQCRAGSDGHAGLRARSGAV